MNKTILIGNALNDQDRVKAQTIIMNNFSEYRTAFIDGSDIFLQIVPKLQVKTSNIDRLTITITCLEDMVNKKIDFSDPIFERKKFLNLFLYQKTVAISPEEQASAIDLTPKIELMGGTVISGKNADFIVVSRPNPRDDREITSSYISFLADSDRFMTFDAFFNPKKIISETKKKPLSQSSHNKNKNIDKSQQLISFSQTRTKKSKIEPDENSYTIDAIFSQSFEHSNSKKLIETNHEKKNKTLKNALEAMNGNAEEENGPLISVPSLSQSIPRPIIAGPLTPFDKNEEREKEKEIPKSSTLILTSSSSPSHSQKFSQKSNPVSSHKSNSLSQKSNSLSQKSNSLSQKSKHSQKSLDPSQRTLLSYQCIGSQQSTLSLSQNAKVDKKTRTLRSLMDNPSSLSSQRKTKTEQTLISSQKRKKAEKPRDGMIQKTLNLSNGTMSIPLARDERITLPEREQPKSLISMPRPALECFDDNSAFAHTKMTDMNNDKLIEVCKDLMSIKSPLRSDENASNGAEADSVTIFSQVPVNDYSETDSDTGMNLEYDENSIQRSQNVPCDSESDNEATLLALLGNQL